MAPGDGGGQRSPLGRTRRCFFSLRGWFSELFFVVLHFLHSSSRQDWNLCKGERRWRIRVPRRFPTLCSSPRVSVLCASPGPRFPVKKEALRTFLRRRVFQLESASTRTASNQQERPKRGSPSVKSRGSALFGYSSTRVPSCGVSGEYCNCSGSHCSSLKNGLTVWTPDTSVARPWLWIETLTQMARYLKVVHHIGKLLKQIFLTPYFDKYTSKPKMSKAVFIFIWVKTSKHKRWLNLIITAWVWECR